MVIKVGVLKRKMWKIKTINVVSKRVSERECQNTVSTVDKASD